MGVIAFFAALYLILFMFFTWLREMFYIKRILPKPPPEPPKQSTLSRKCETIDVKKLEDEEIERQFLNEQITALEIRRQRFINQSAQYEDGSKEDIALEGKILTLNKQLHALYKKQRRLNQ